MFAGSGYNASQFRDISGQARFVSRERATMSRTDAKATIIEPQVATAVELSGDPGISAMLHRVEDLSRADDAQQVLRVFAEGMRQLQKLGAYLSLSTRGLGPGDYKVTRFMPDIGTPDLD